jgi:hypothetical protein
VRAQTSSTVTLGDGASVSRNTARGNGGGLSLLSSLATAGRVSVRDNAATGSSSVGGGIAASTSTDTASKGSGGGLVVSGDSSVTLAASTAVFSQNTATHQGGGLFIRAGQSEFDSSKATYSIVAKVTFWRLDLVGNTATTGDGGGDDHFAPLSGQQMICFVQEKCTLKTCSNPNRMSVNQSCD